MYQDFTMSRYLPRLGLALAIFCSLTVHAIELDDIDIPYDEFTLDNGLRVIVHTDRSTPIVSMNTWYHVGSKNEPEGKTGFAHLFEHLMFQGSENYNDEYFKPLQEVGATGINGTTNADRTNYFQTVPTEAVERMLFLESDRVTHLLGVITQERLDEQRGVVQNEKRQRANQPYGTAFEHMLRGIFPPGHPYRHPVIGSMQDLNAASLDDVYQWFEDYYGATNMVIALAGDIDLETARTLMQKYFGDAPAGKPIARIEQWVPELKTNRYEVLEDRAPIGLIYRVWPMSSDTADTVGMRLWGTAFADGRTSALYKALVEEHKLASSVSANAIDFEIASLFYVSVDLLPGADADEARRILDETLNSFLTSMPDPERLQRLKTQSLTNTVRGLERASTKASVLVSGAVLHDDPVHFKRELTLTQEATAESLDALAEKWLTQPYYELTGRPFGQYVSAEEGTDRSALPPLGEPSTLEFPEIKEHTTKSGIPLVLARRDSLPLTDLTIRFNFGTLDEPVAELGVAASTFSQLQSGTRSRDAETIEAEIERLGGYVNADAHSTFSDVSTGGLSENLPELLALVADLLQAPNYPEERLDIYKSQRISSIKFSRSDPNSVASDALYEQVFGKDHPRGQVFLESHVEAINRDALLDYHRNQVLGQPFKVLAVGNVSMDELEEMVEAAFADWPSAAPRPPTAAPEAVALPEGVRVFLIDMPESEQSVITAAHVAPPSSLDPQVDALIANEIIGGSFVSRINMNLREDKGWSYGARTSLADNQFQRTFTVSASVQVDKTAESLAEINRELHEFLGPQTASEEEFKLALERRIRSLSSSFQTGRAVLQNIKGNESMKRPWDHTLRYGEALKTVNIEEVRTAAEALLHPEKLTYVIAGDLSVMEAPVRALGFGEVKVLEMTE